MDVDIGNIFYIVLTLVVVIIGVLGRKKKPASPGSGIPGKAARPSFMDSLERVLQMEQDEPMIMAQESYEEEFPKEKPEADEVAQMHDARKPEMGILEEYNLLRKPYVEGEAALDTTDKESVTGPLEVVDLDAEEGANFFELIENFDAKRAILYSCIINRLDY